MADREIIRIDVDDTAFAEFKKKFDAYEAAVKALPGEWQKSSTEIASTKSHFEQMADSIRGQAEDVANIVTAHGKLGAVFDTSAIALASMTKSGMHFSGHIFQATASLRHWSKLSALFGGLVGAGGLFGISRMALNVAGQRSSAAGLGVTYGERASFLANFGRLPGAEGLLQGFSQAEVDVGKQYALRQYLGHGASGDPAKDFAEGLGRFKTLVDSTPKELLGPALQQRGYDKLGLDTGFAQTVKGMSRSEIEQISRGYGADLATRLGLSPDVARKWTEFETRIEKAGEDIDTILWKGTSKLTKPLEDLSLGFEHLVSALFRDGSPVSEWIKKLGHGISVFAEDLGSGTTHAFAEALIRDAREAARWLAAIVTKPLPGGSAWKTAELAAIAAAAARGFSAAAIAEALAAGGPAAVAALGAGAVGLGMNKLMPQHPERLRRGQEYENAGGSPTSPHPAATRARKGDWQGPMQPEAQGPWQGPPMPPMGPWQGPMQPHSAPPGTPPAAAPGTPWNHMLHEGDENIPLSGGAAGRRDSLSGMQPGFRSRLAAMFHDAPPGASVFSGYRSPALQAELYRRPHRPGYVARPGHSHHGFGDAADIHGDLDWFHRHAHEYGLRFPMPYENWHIQSDPNTRVPIPQHAIPASPRRAAFGHMQHRGHHSADVSHAQHTTMIEDQSGGMVSVSGDSSRYGGHELGGGERFRYAVDFYRKDPEHFQPMIGNVEDRRFEGPLRAGLLPDVPDAPVSGRMARRLSGPGKPLGAYRPSGLPPIEKSVDDFLNSLSEKRNRGLNNLWNKAPTS